MTILLTGAVLAGIYILIAQGFNLGVLGSGGFNFAYPAIVITGAYAAHQFGTKGDLPILVIMIIAALLGAAVNLVVELVALRPVVGRGTHGELVTTIGASTVILGLLVSHFGPDILAVPPVVSSELVEIFGGRIPIDGLALIGFAVLVTLVLLAWSRLTLGGLACRATTNDRDAALLRGIRVGRLSMYTAVAAGALAGLTGVIIGTQTFASLSVSLAITLKGFLALILGGFGSFEGAFVGGAVVGVVEALASRFLGHEYTNLTLFVTLLIVLLTMPTGFFGRRLERAI